MPSAPSPFCHALQIRGRSSYRHSILDTPAKQGQTQLLSGAQRLLMHTINRSPRTPEQRSIASRGVLIAALILALVIPTWAVPATAQDSSPPDMPDGSGDAASEMAGTATGDIGFGQLG